MGILSPSYRCFYVCNICHYHDCEFRVCTSDSKHWELKRGEIVQEKKKVEKIEWQSDNSQIRVIELAEDVRNKEKKR